MAIPNFTVRWREIVRINSAHLLKFARIVNRVTKRLAAIKRTSRQAVNPAVAEGANGVADGGANGKESPHGGG